LYDADPFHAEWEFVARIYSHVRNEVLKLGKQAPIRAFLATACPVMNMVAPESYLTTCGWEIKSMGSGSNRRHELIREEGAEELVERLRKTTPSLNGFDLLLRCLANGYDVYNAQQVLCHMMERQEHLMTKAFLVEDDGHSQHSSTTAVKTPSSEDMSRGGDFFSWAVEKPSPARELMLGDGGGQANGHGGNVMHFDDMQPVPNDGVLDGPNEMVFRLDMPMGVYKYPSDGGDALHGADMVLQIDDLTGHEDTGAGTRDPFGVGGHFDNDYMNAALSKFLGGRRDVLGSILT
jgi:hypothetical protein